MQDPLKQAQQHLQNTLYTLGDQPILLLLSGGSALHLVDDMPKEVLGEHLTVSVLDERFSWDPLVNNFLQLTGTEFYRKVSRAGCSLVSTEPFEGESINDLATRFEHDLRAWKTRYPSGILLATQGIGPNGHTAGIMPYPEDKSLFHQLFESERWVVGYNTGSKNPHPERVTTTITFLKDVVDLSIVYAVGVEKRNILERLYAKNEDLASLPAGIIWQVKQVKLFTDLSAPREIRTPDLDVRTVLL